MIVNTDIKGLFSVILVVLFLAMVVFSLSLLDFVYFVLLLFYMIRIGWFK